MHYDDLETEPDRQKFNEPAHIATRVVTPYTRPS